MTLMLAPYAEKIVSDFVRGHPDIVTLGARVVGKTPGDTEPPWIRVTQLNGPSNLHPEHLIDFYIQFDCYAGATGGQPEANLLTRTLRAVLGVMPQAQHTGAVVTAAIINGDARIPDADLVPARERHIVTATIYMHP